MAGKRVMILTAVRIEAKAVARSLGLRRTGKFSWTSGANQRLPISMYMIGMGAVRLPAIDPSEMRFILMAGLAGGLDPSLQIGDLVIDEQSTYSTHVKALRGQIFTSKTLIATPADKADCFARSRAVAVDMENQIVRDWAAKMDIPFLGIRAISDRSDHLLNAAIVNAIDEFGRLRPSVLTRALLSRPQRIASLIRIARHARSASRCLEEAVARLVGFV